MSAEVTLLQSSKPPISLDIEGSRVLFWPSKEAQPPNATLVFIVGNPGLCDYYVQYLTELQRLVHSDGRSSLEVFCVSQKGHDPHALSSPDTLISLDEQIQNKADILFAINKRWIGARRPKVLLAGHSIGAYMALELVRRRLTPTSVTAIHLLFPTLHHIGQTPNARRLAWLLKADDRPIVSRHVPSLLMLLTFVVSVALKIMQFLPLPIVHFLILCGSPMQPYDAIKITADFVLNAQCVQQALFMAREEMRLVTQVQALEEEKETKPDGVSSTQSRIDGRDVGKVKLRAYWASGDLDGWVPESTRVVVEEALGLKGYELPADIIDKHRSVEVQKTHRKKRSYTVDEIRQARRSGGGKRRALAGMVHAGASAGYGLASSLGNLGYRRNRAAAAAAARAGGPPRAPSSGMRHFQPSPLSSPVRQIRRRPSLLAARASRRFDGTIVIEPADQTDDEGLDLLARDAPDGVIAADGVVFSPGQLEPSFDEAFSPKSAAAAIKANGRGGDDDDDVFSETPPLRMPDRASIVCKLGMPHAFVLGHSDKMAALSSAMVIADIV